MLPIKGVIKFICFRGDCCNCRPRCSETDLEASQTSSPPFLYEEHPISIWIEGLKTRMWFTVQIVKPAEGLYVM